VSLQEHAVGVFQKVVVDGSGEPPLEFKWGAGDEVRKVHAHDVQIIRPKAKAGDNI